MSQLSDLGQRTLLEIARDSVRSYLSGRLPVLPEIETGELADMRALFVSIHAGESLRGCVGTLYPTCPLYRSASECAISAAVGDPRFVPLMPSELSDVSFEISVLSPVEPIHHAIEIEIGAHGLLVVKGRSRGLLLPQVASQYGWDQERFLAETCRKAGLSNSENAEIYRFTAHVFGEQPIHNAHFAHD